MSAAVSAAAMHAKLDEDIAALVDNFEGLLRCAQARSGHAKRRPNPQRMRRCLRLPRGAAACRHASAHADAPRCRAGAERLRLKRR
jgi:hypothetical protein